MIAVPKQTVTRLLQYKRLLQALQQNNQTHIYSKELAAMAMTNAAQVRRDIMQLPGAGSAVRGYNIPELIANIESLIPTDASIPVIIAGAGKIGHALMAYFSSRQSPFQIVAALDSDPAKAGTVQYGIRIYPLTEIAEICARYKVKIGIIATPTESAQRLVDNLVEAGVSGFLNFSSALIKTPDYVFVNNTDINLNLELVAFNALTQGARSYD
jgi:redox-sensing transcriptional repressor